MVFVNTASASGPFIEELSGPGRTIVTATRTGAERFATLFGGYFVDALSGDAADADQEPPRVGARGIRCRTSSAWRVRTSRKGTCSPSIRCSTTAATKRAAPIPSADGKNGRIAAMLSLGTPQRPSAAGGSESARAVRASGATSSAASKA